MTAADLPVRAVTPDGHDPADWAPRIGSAPLLELTGLVAALGCPEGATRLLVLSAHPDDETIGAGRLLSAWLRDVGPVTAVVATAGEACLDQVAARPTDLAELRIAEWHAAMDRFGVDQREILGLGDGALAGHEDQLLQALGGIVGHGTDRDVAVVTAPFPSDPHPDHAAVGRAARELAGAWGIPFVGFPVWLTYFDDPERVLGETLVRLSTAVVDDVARADALRCFRTQLEPWDPGLGPVLPASMLAHHAEQLLLLDMPVD